MSFAELCEISVSTGHGAILSLGLRSSRSALSEEDTGCRLSPHSLGALPSRAGSLSLTHRELFPHTPGAHPPPETPPSPTGSSSLAHRKLFPHPPKGLLSSPTGSPSLPTVSSSLIHRKLFPHAPPHRHLHKPAIRLKTASLTRLILD